MSSKTVRLKSSVYDRLQAYKRSDESFSEAVDRLLDDAQSNWQSSVGTMSDEDAERARELVTGRPEDTPKRSTRVLRSGPTVRSFRSRRKAADRR